ncbi:MAG: MmcQ/YjbR family DNA-binding protein [Clostridia bacterium]|nr:MmcQ/YjbR family DNA-binding protein [Clostridia bacterium]
MNRQEVVAFIKTEFGVEEEHLWMNFSDYIVFRNPKNKKWFAIIMNIEKKKLGLEGEGQVNIIDLQCDPILIGSLLLGEGYLPAYHMNKASWITVLLDGSANENELKDLIRLSYEIIEKKAKKR